MLGSQLGLSSFQCSAVEIFRLTDRDGARGLVASWLNDGKVSKVNEGYKSWTLVRKHYSKRSSNTP